MGAAGEVCMQVHKVVEREGIEPPMSLRDSWVTASVQAICVLSNFLTKIVHAISAVHVRLQASRVVPPGPLGVTAPPTQYDLEAPEALVVVAKALHGRQQISPPVFKEPFSHGF